MSVINCPDCGRKVSSEASACPHCGCPGYRIHSAARASSWWSATKFIIIILTIAVAIIANEDNENSRSTEPERLNSETMSTAPAEGSHINSNIIKSDNQIDTLLEANLEGTDTNLNRDNEYYFNNECLVDDTPEIEHMDIESGEMEDLDENTIEDIAYK